LGGCYRSSRILDAISERPIPALGFDDGLKLLPGVRRGFWLNARFPRFTGQLEEHFFASGFESFEVITPFQGEENTVAGHPACQTDEGFGQSTDETN